MQHLTARLTADATVKTFDSGRSVVNFNVIQNYSYTNKSGERITDTDFYECSYWLTAKVAPYLTKGRLVELIGRVGTRAYEGRDGKPVAVLQLKASQIVFHTAQKKKEEDEPVKEKAAPRGRKAKAENDDLPF